MENNICNVIITPIMTRISRMYLLSQVPIILDLNIKQIKLPTAQNISDENTPTGAKYSKSSHKSSSSPTTQIQSNNSHERPKSSSKYTDEAPTTPTLQIKNDKAFDPTNYYTNHAKVLILSNLSNSSTSRFHRYVAALVHRLNMDIPMKQLNLETLEEYLEYIRINFSHLETQQANICVCNSVNDDTFY